MPGEAVAEELKEENQDGESGFSLSVVYLKKKKNYIYI